ncbi:hypothetical protein QUF76_14530 [Desulfobacterales bacterium HSG16]|nr:hypothetical protein [Desulfobacterales bacterium HSG16]
MIYKRFLPFICITVFIGYATPVSACNVCTMAFFDYLLPPLFLWQIFPVIWFIAVCSVSDKDDPQWGVPKRTISGVLTGIGTVIIGNMFGFGPLFSLILLLPPIILSFKAMSKNIRKRWGEKQSKKYITVSAIGTAALFCLILSSIWIRYNRTSGEYVLTWGMSGRGRSIIEELRTDPLSDLDEIRLIVSKSDFYVSEELLETLAVRGDPSKDFSILLDVLRRTKKESYGVDAIEAALKKISGIELPEGTDANDWEKAFSNRINESASPSIPSSQKTN